MALTLLFLLGWTLLTSPLLWTLSVIGILLLPSLYVTLLDLFRKPDEVLLKQHLIAVARSVVRRLMQFTFELA